MVINILGECDKRPVIYTLLKVLQEFGDVLYLSNNTGALRLSDTRQSFGHYQNVMVAVTDDNYDDFFQDAPYGLDDFENVIIEGLDCEDPDMTIFVEGMRISDFESQMLDMVEEYKTIKLYKNKLYSSMTAKRVEEFEAFADMVPMPSSVVSEVVKVITPLNIAPQKSLLKIATRERSVPKKSLIKK